MLPSPPHLKPDYGIDTPIVVRNLLAIGLAAITISFLLWRLEHGLPEPVSRLGVPFCFWFGLSFSVTGVILYASKIGKLKFRDRIIQQLNLQGHERVLDLGCGRGLLLIGVAEKLTSGRAVGIDSWKHCDITTAEENTRRANVADKVELHTGDILELPFADARFDVIVSSWAFHNIPTQAGRLQAIRELWRVLKPGGRFAIVDISNLAEYQPALVKWGCTDLKMQGPYFTLLIPSYLLVGTVPIMLRRDAEAKTS